MLNYAEKDLPVLFINRTIGKKIPDDEDNIIIDYYLNQRFNE